jgi:hypothetical protein
MRVDASLSAVPNWFSSLMTSLSLVGTIIRCCDLQDAGATAAQKESERVIEAPTALCLHFQSREVLFPDWQVRSKRGETAVRGFRTSVSPIVRNQGEKRSSVKL